jgi:hypothetical protein
MLSFLDEIQKQDYLKKQENKSKWRMYPVSRSEKSNFIT